MAKTILLVEDEASLADRLKEALEYARYNVLHASKGDDALKMVETHNIDLILLDVVIPKINGLDILKTLREKNYKMPIIMISNLSQDVEIGKAKELGADDYIVKSNTSLKQIVDKVNAKVGTQKKAH